MKREASIEKVRSRKKAWDIVVIGGGATGLGIAVDAASRNFSILLVEQSDFAKGTSSRSTKLVHGGVRYLQQGNVSLVLEALHERGVLKRNAPHLVNDLSFIIPTYDWWESPFYTVGLKLYDMMAGKLGLGPSMHLSKEETVQAISTVNQEGLRGGVIYHDGQFDDARMAISLAQTADDYGAVLANYMKVTNILKRGGIVNGVEVADMESGEQFSISAKVVINATGVFSDAILKMDDLKSKDSIKPSQGVHIVVDKEFLPGKHAFLIPQTTDGRVLFAVPWHGKVLLGTTDTAVEQTSLEPKALTEEIDFILNNASIYFAKKPAHSDIRSIFAGLRPLISKNGESLPENTKELSRSHKIVVSDSALVSVLGGKWTTYRKMAEDAVNHAILVGNLEARACITEDLLIHGFVSNADFKDPMHVYGNDIRHIRAIEKERPSSANSISKKLIIKESQVIWAVREEMARTLEDVLARRTRILFLDAAESMAIAQQTANIMARELKKDESWVRNQLIKYNEVAKNYLVN